MLLPLVLIITVKYFLYLLHSLTMSTKFTDDVIFAMLSLIRELKIFSKIDGRRERNSDVYNKLADAINNQFGLTEETKKLTGTQCNTKWKSLKSTYREEKSKAGKSGTEKNILFIKQCNNNNLI